MPLTVRSMNTNLTAVLFFYSSAKWCLGTLSNGTIGLTLWFQGIYLITQDKKGASAMQLHRQLGIWGFV